MKFTLQGLVHTDESKLCAIKEIISTIHRLTIDSVPRYFALCFKLTQDVKSLPRHR